MESMNQYDVAGLLKTYAEASRRAYNTKKLQELVRELKRELNYETIRKMYVDEPYIERNPRV